MFQTRALVAPLFPWIEAPSEVGTLGAITVEATAAWVALRRTVMRAVPALANSVWLRLAVSWLLLTKVVLSAISPELEGLDQRMASPVAKLAPLTTSVVSEPPATSEGLTDEIENGGVPSDA